MVIGVAGGSGSGKTTVVRRIVESLGPDQVTVLEHDRYYRDRNDLRFEERLALNYDHPDALETNLLVRHLRSLKAGETIEAPRYDFTLFARLDATETISPRKAIIVEGILIFTDASLRDLMDVKVFVDADADTRFIRRLRRDVAERGRTMDNVVEQYPGNGEADALRLRGADEALRGSHHPGGRPQHRRHRHDAFVGTEPDGVSGRSSVIR